MYPIGHVAFSYLLARPAIRRQPSVAEFGSLTAGSLLPAAGNVALKYLSIPGVTHSWSHSPLLLIPLGLLGALIYVIPFRFRWVPLLFAVGVASHLINDIIFAFPLLYLSNATDDVGGSWFFPWRLVLFRYNGPGFDIQPWELMLEGVFLLGTLWMWKRWDLVFYGSFVSVFTVVWLALGL